MPGWRPPQSPIPNRSAQRWRPLDVPPSRAVHIGDLAADVAGAAAAGLSSVFVGESPPDDCPVPTHVVGTLADLVETAPPWVPAGGADAGDRRAE